MISKLVGVATLFAAGSILVAGTPTLGAKALDTQAAASSYLGCGPHCGPRPVAKSVIGIETRVA
jgi:hypothetical protein